MRKTTEELENEAFNTGCIAFILGDIVLIAGLSNLMDLPFAIILTIILTPITSLIFFFFGKGLSLLINSDKYEPEVKKKPYKPRMTKVLEVVEETQAFRDLKYSCRETEILDHECSWCGKEITKSDYDIYHEKCYQCFDMLDSSDD